MSARSSWRSRGCAPRTPGAREPGDRPPLRRHRHLPPRRRPHPVGVDALARTERRVARRAQVPQPGINRPALHRRPALRSERRRPASSGGQRWPSSRQQGGAHHDLNPNPTDDPDLHHNTRHDWSVGSPNLNGKIRSRSGVFTDRISRPLRMSTAARRTTLMPTTNHWGTSVRGRRHEGKGLCADLPCTGTGYPGPTRIRADRPPRAGPWPAKSYVRATSTAAARTSAPQTGTTRSRRHPAANPCGVLVRFPPASTKSVATDKSHRKRSWNHDRNEHPSREVPG